MAKDRLSKNTRREFMILAAEITLAAAIAIGTDTLLKDEGLLVELFTRLGLYNGPGRKKVEESGFTNEKERLLLELVRQHRRKIGIVKPLELFSSADIYETEIRLSKEAIRLEETGYMDSVIGLLAYYTSLVLAGYSKPYVAVIGPIEEAGGNFEQRNKRMGIRSGLDLYNLTEPKSRDWLKHVAAHETGHAIDPFYNAKEKYSREDYLVALEGRWRALSRAFSVEGKYMANPEAYGAKKMFMDLGATYGNQMLSNLEKGKNIEDMFSDPAYTRELETFFQSDVKQVIFNRKTCLKLGSKIFKDVLEGRVDPRGNWFGVVVNESIEHGCVEIWADMVSDVISGVNKDSQIEVGVLQVLKLVTKGKFDLDAVRLRMQDSELPEKYIKKFLVEKEQDEKRKNNQNGATEVTSIRVDTPGLEFEARQKRIMEFYTSQASHRVDKAVLQYQVALVQVCTVHKSLINNDAESLEFLGLFDPELHIWEIRKIEQACDRGIVIKILEGQIVPNLSEHTKILNDFLKSKAFRNTGTVGDIERDDLKLI